MTVTLISSVEPAVYDEPVALIYQSPVGVSVSKSDTVRPVSVLVKAYCLFPQKYGSPYVVLTESVMCPTE